MEDEEPRGSLAWQEGAVSTKQRLLLHHGLAAGTRGVGATDVNEVTPFVTLTPTVALALLLLHTVVSQKQGEMKKYLCWLPNRLKINCC